MDNSDKSVASSMPTFSGDRPRRQTRSITTSQLPTILSSSASIPTSSNANYPIINPYTLPITPIAPNSPFVPRLLPIPHQTVNRPPIHIPGTSFPAGFPNTPPQLPYHSPPAMWPFVPQQFTSNVPSSAGLVGYVDSLLEGHIPYPVIETSPSPPKQEHIPVPSSTQIPSSSNSSQGRASVDPQEAAINEDKRRRNTAASARFRIKKKQKNINLERTVTDLTSRAEELEREATSLRRENSWLKEMVIMKGRQNMANVVRSSDQGAPSDGGESSDKETSRNTDKTNTGKVKKRKKKREKSRNGERAEQSSGSEGKEV